MNKIEIFLQNLNPREKFLFISFICLCALFLAFKIHDHFFVSHDFSLCEQVSSRLESDADLARGQRVFLPALVADEQMPVFVQTGAQRLVFCGRTDDRDLSADAAQTHFQQFHSCYSLHAASNSSK